MRRIDIKILLIIGIIVVINFMSYVLFFRIDFTQDKRYTMSDATKDILDELNAVVSIKVYFSEEVPPELLKSRRDMQDLLIEYENSSSGNVVYEFINPNVSEETEKEAQQKGISPVRLNLRERDQAKQLRVYMGAIINYEDRQEVVPYIQQNQSYEYVFTTSIKKVSVKEKPQIAIIQANGIPQMNELFELREKLSVLYQVEPYRIQENIPIDPKYKLVALIDPKDSLPEFYFKALDNFLAQGKNIFLCYSPVKGDLSGSGALMLAENTDITSWLEEKGIVMGNQFLIDASCGQVMVAQQQDFYVFQSSINFPYFPIISKFAQHPISKGFERIQMTFTGSLSFSQDSLKKITPLLFSSEKTGFIAPPSYINIEKEWTEADFPESSQPIAAAIEGEIQGNPNSKMVVIANGNFMVNEGGQQGNGRMPESNINLAVNSIDWLADDTGLIDLRTKTITSRPIKEMDAITKDILSYMNVLLPIFLLLLYSFYRYQKRIRIKQKRIMGKIL